ncbi:MAG: hypothetical protein COA42_15335 [Alteromonadaceae bacterium]|nr:MAG: hypothetical protein COA42_15335 [Alteromonadaceae bacterium]
MFLSKAKLLMKRAGQFLILSLLTIVWISSPALAQKRVALVIGNSKYTQMQSLPNPSNDARLMADTLGKLGFDVISASDVDFIGMRRAVKAFGKKLRASGIFLGQEVELFCEAFLLKSKSSAAIANICKPAYERWTKRYKSALDAFKHAKNIYEHTKKSGDLVLIANAENDLKSCKQEKDALEIFKKDLGTFVRFYEFMSQIVDYDNKDLEKLSLYARHLRPMLSETNIDDDDVDLSGVILTHYRLSKMREQEDLGIAEASGEYTLTPGESLGTAKPKDKKEEFLSLIISRLNEMFVTDGLTEKDMVNYAHTIVDKLRENIQVMNQIDNNSPEQAMLGDFSKALEDAILDSNDVHQNQMMQLLTDMPRKQLFARLIYNLLVTAQPQRSRLP